MIDDGRGPSSRAGRARTAFGPIVVLLVVAAGLWAASLATFDRASLAAIGDVGLGPLLPWTFYGAIVVLLASFALLLRDARPPAVLALAHYGLLIGIWHATPAILYGTPRYPFAYKHIGVAGFIQEHGRVDPFIDAYFNWPGFFALSGFVSELAGLDVFVLAVWAPPVMNVLIVAGLLVLLRGLTADPRHLWLAGWIFLLADWVGQDYFAPQAFAYALHLALLGTYVAFFARRRRAARRDRDDAWARLEARLDDPDGADLDGADPAPTDDGRARADDPTSGGEAPIAASAGEAQDGGSRLLPAPARALLLVLLTASFAAVAAAHQLTPFMTIASLAALVLVGLGRAPMLVAVMVSVQAGWFATMAVPYFAGHLGELVASIGRLIDNFTIASQVLTGSTAGPLSLQRIFVLDVRQGLTLFVAATAVVGWIRRWRAGHRDGTATVLLLVPASMIALQPYGGEIIMRIYLFTVPLLAFFAAAAVHPGGHRPEPGGRAAMVTFGITAALAAGMTVAYYGNESMNYVAPLEIAVLDDLYDLAPAGSLVVTATDNPPVRHRRYAQLEYVDLGRFDVAAAPDGGLGSLDDVADALLAAGRPAAYLLLTDSQEANARLFGVLSGIDWDVVTSQLLASPRFTLRAGNERARLFEVRPSARAGTGG